MPLLAAAEDPLICWSMRFDYPCCRIFTCRATNVHGHAIIQSQQLTQWPSLAVKSINWLYIVQGRLICCTSIELFLERVTSSDLHYTWQAKMQREFQACCSFFEFEYPQTLLWSLQTISGFLTVFFPQTRLYLCCSSGFSSTLEQRWISSMKSPTYPLASLDTDLKYVWEKSMAIIQMQEERSFQGLTQSEAQQKKEDDECTQLNFQGKSMNRNKCQ